MEIKIDLVKTPITYETIEGLISCISYDEFCKLCEKFKVSSFDSLCKKLFSENFIISINIK
jgi:hypothetical protein